MTELTARIIAVVVTLGVVCCVVVMIVAVHSLEGTNYLETGNVTPEGSPTGLDQPEDIQNEEESRNATLEQVPEEVQGVENVTPEGLPKKLNLSKLVQRALDAVNMTPEELPDEVMEEIVNIERFAKFGGICKWRLDPQNKQVIIHAYFIRDEKKVNAIQGRQISGWTFQVIHDVDYEKELEHLGAELVQFQKDHPELQISGFETSPTELDIWVTNRTPENEALDGTVMYNRTVQVIGGTWACEAREPPLSNTRQDDSGNWRCNKRVLTEGREAHAEAEE